MTNNQRRILPLSQVQTSEEENDDLELPPVPEGKVRIHIIVDEVHLGDPGPAFSGTECEFGDMPVVSLEVAEILIANRQAKLA